MINDYLFPVPDEYDRALLRITTEMSARLSPSQFERRLAEKINEASKERGRVVYAVDVTASEVVAAASYHLPIKRADPIQVTALAPRKDEAQSEFGRYCIPILKWCIHEISAHSSISRGERLTLWASGEFADLAKADYGFRLGKVPTGRASGSEFLVQDRSTVPEP